MQHAPYLLIAAYYGVDPARLTADNAVPSDLALAVGQTLVVRFPRQVHAVSPGETLYSIAARYGITQTWPGLIGTMIVIQPPACLASAFIYTYTYGGFAGSGQDIMHAVFMQASQSIFAASFISELVTGFLDKTVLVIVLMLVFRALPEKFRVCTPFKGKKDDDADDE